MEQMTSEQFVALIDSVIENYHGDSDVLFSSIGALMAGRKYGWRVLMIVSSSASYAKYQKILGVQFKQILPEYTPLSERSLGYRVVKRLNNFWDVVRGSYSIDRNEKRRFA
jgi:hypothetical protein